MSSVAQLSDVQSPDMRILLGEIQKYETLYKDIITKVSGIEKDIETTQRISEFHDQTISRMSTYLEDIHQEMKNLSVSSITKDIDFAHNTLREHGKEIGDLKSYATNAFKELTEKVMADREQRHQEFFDFKEAIIKEVNTIANKGGQAALKAWGQAAIIIGTIIGTIITTILISKVIGG